LGRDEEEAGRDGDEGGGDSKADAFLLATGTECLSIKIKIKINLHVAFM
jgi:hypothetical protein